MCCVDIEQLPYMSDTNIIDNMDKIMPLNKPIIFGVANLDLGSSKRFQSSILMNVAKKNGAEISNNGNRTVLFLEEDLVHEVESHATYSQEERERSWYSGRDLINMRTDAEEALSLEISDLPLTSYEKYLRTKAIRKVVSYVLETQMKEQKLRQKKKIKKMTSGSNEAVPIEEIVASVCNGISGSSKVRAAFYGKLNAKEVTEIYKQDGFQFSKLSRSKIDISLYQQTNLVSFRESTHQKKKTSGRRRASFSSAVNNIKSILTKGPMKGLR